ncbi:MAG TPA: hypothetical protein DD405_06715 [Desulfobacteraceae bacterium]|nr:hypothetical protein [Desulfobacteraceae bacterium]
MKKYKTVLINKESSESYGYRLDKIPYDIIRNGRPIVPAYNSGKSGLKMTFLIRILFMLFFLIEIINFPLQKRHNL